MKYIKDFMRVEIKKDQNLTTEIKTADGIKTLDLGNIYNRLDKDYIPEGDEYIPFKGKLIQKPLALGRKATKAGMTLDELIEGCTVYLHHLAVNEDRLAGEDEYHLSYPRDMVGSITSNIICQIVDGEIIPTFDWNLFKPVDQIHQSSTIIIPEHLKQKKREDILQSTHLSRQLIKEGYAPGDTFAVREQAIYTIKIEKLDYIAVRTENILANTK